MTNKIKELRNQKKLSLAALENVTGISAQQLNRLEKGERRLNEDNLRVIANALECAPEDLISDGNIVKIPVIGFVPGGLPEDVFEHIADEYLNYPIISGSLQSFYALKVSGDSMNRVVSNGSYIVIDSTKRNLSDLDGKLVIARKYGECTFKRLCINPNLLMPESYDKSYKPINLDEDWEIIGLVVGAINKFET